MSNIHITLMFRALVNERLIAAAEEIFGIVDRTITEEVSRSRQETFYQQSKCCHINTSPSISGFEDGAAPEQQHSEQEGSLHLKQQQPEAPQIKEEHDELWNTQMLRTLVNECLTAAAEEICGIFDRTMAEYEEGVSLSKQDNVRHRRKPEMTSRRADTQQVHASEEEDSSEQQHCEREASPNMQREHPEPTQVKEEREELWTTEGGEELQEPEEDDIIKFVLPHAGFGNDQDRGEDEQFPGMPPEPMMAEPDGVDFGESEPTEDHSQSSEEGDSDGDWQESGDPQLSSCKLCGKTFRYRGCLLKHIIQTHASNTECLCGVCGQLLESTDSLRLHLETHTCERTPKPRHRPVCHLCGKTVKVMKYHMRIHTGEKPYSCKTCGTQFVRNSDLTRHMSIHTGERPYSCTLCEKRFTRSNDVVRHMSTHEGGAPYKPYSCTECGMDFSRRRSLNEHMMTHTGEKLCSCEICGEGFTRSDGLKRHMRIHTGETPFNCSVCGAGFTRRDTLRNHRKIHSGKEPLSCSECNIEFNHRRSLTVHMRKHRAGKIELVS